MEIRTSQQNLNNISLRRELKSPTVFLPTPVIIKTRTFDLGARHRSREINRTVFELINTNYTRFYVIRRKVCRLGFRGRRTTETNGLGGIFINYFRVPFRCRRNTI